MEVDQAVVVHLDRVYEQVFYKIAAAWAEVVRVGVGHQGGQVQIEAAADAGFEHAADPNGDAVLPAIFEDAQAFCQSADAARFEVEFVEIMQAVGGGQGRQSFDLFVQADPQLGELALRPFDPFDLMRGEGLFDRIAEAGEEFKQRQVVGRQSAIGIEVHPVVCQQVPAGGEIGLAKVGIYLELQSPVAFRLRFVDGPLEGLRRIL